MLLTIDYLILNFKGKLQDNSNGLYKEDVSNPFTTQKHQYGNKTFADVYTLFCNDEKIGVINSNPRANIIDENLVQIQYENHLFYTYSLSELKDMVFAITDYFDIKYDGINRLDIAFDKTDSDDKYKTLYTDLVGKNKKVKGRKKSVSAYMETDNGNFDFNGFSIGKRSSSRLLRIYNKTKALNEPKNPKTYINDYFTKNGLENTNAAPVWRFEYQLNSTFFTYLRERENHITWQIFDFDFLLQLIRMAEKNHFEIVHSTGKSETNKEETYQLVDWDALKDKYDAVTRYIASKVNKVFEPSITTQKRLIKSLFRQYYIEPNLSFLYPLCKIINEYNLKDWFYEKYNFYVREFMDREKIKNFFNETAFTDRYYSLTN